MSDYMNSKAIPVYLFLGFLEAGKTRFIQKALADEKFGKDENILLLVFEEGIEEFDFSAFSHNNVTLHIIDDGVLPDTEELCQMSDKCRADRIVIEYNGMMHIADLIIGKPENWKIFQTVMIADASTFSMYEQNMRSLVVDKANICDVVIFNRYVKKADINELHSIIRSVNRRTEIYYEADNGMMIADDIEDPLPFNINAPVVVIKDDDYAVWYSDIMNEAVKYHEKTVKFKAMIGSRPELPPNVFAVGRFIMTCCEADMEFCWFVAFYNRYHEVKGDIWALITAEITVQHHENENIDIPLLRITELYECAPPEIEIASF